MSRKDTENVSFFGKSPKEDGDSITSSSIEDKLKNTLSLFQDIYEFMMKDGKISDTYQRSYSEMNELEKDIKIISNNLFAEDDKKNFLSFCDVVSILFLLRMISSRNDEYFAKETNHVVDLLKKYGLYELERDVMLDGRSCRKFEGLDRLQYGPFDTVGQIYEDAMRPPRPGRSNLENIRKLDELIYGAELIGEELYSKLNKQAQTFDPNSA